METGNSWLICVNQEQNMERVKELLSQKGARVKGEIPVYNYLSIFFEGTKEDLLSIPEVISVFSNSKLEKF